MHGVGRAGFDHDGCHDEWIVAGLEDDKHSVRREKKLLSAGANRCILYKGRMCGRQTKGRIELLLTGWVRFAVPTGLGMMGPGSASAN